MRILFSFLTALALGLSAGGSEAGEIAALSVAACETFVLGAELLLTTLGFVTMTLSLGCCCCCGAGGGRTEGTEGEGVVWLGAGAGGAGDGLVDSKSIGGSSSRSLTMSSRLTGVGVVRPTRVLAPMPPPPGRFISTSILSMCVKAAAVAGLRAVLRLD